jgi:hypothetical protein
MTAEAHIIEALERLAAKVQHARSRMQENDDPALGSLEAQIFELCKTVENLPLPAARALRPRMTALLDDLNQLEASVRRRHAELGSQLGQITARRRAAAAYTSPAAKARSR